MRGPFTMVASLGAWLLCASVSAHPGPKGSDRPRARFDIDLGKGKKREGGKRPPSDRLPADKLRSDIYGRPYLVRAGSDSFDVALGGYLDFLGAYHREEGVDDGWSFEARRFNLFVTSQIASAVRLTSEIEIEHGTEVALETAAIDILFHHAINLRAGILLTPLGKFNIAHDSPIYDIVDRPLVSTQIIPATLSEPGIGLFGTFFPGRGHRLRYEIYVVNGLGDGVIGQDGTRLSEGKRKSTFEKDNNGMPAIAARISYASPPRIVQGEIGLSGYGAIYNTFRVEGERVDDPRWLRIAALDAELAAGPVIVRGEAAYAHVDLPSTLTDLHGRNQFGVYLEAVGKILDRPIGVFDHASLEAAARFDFVDLNLDRRRTDHEPLGDEAARLSVGPAFRPAPGTRLSLIYHHEWHKDLLGNRTRAAGVQLGIASYF